MNWNEKVCRHRCTHSSFTDPVIKYPKTKKNESFSLVFLPLLPMSAARFRQVYTPCLNLPLRLFALKDKDSFYLQPGQQSRNCFVKKKKQKKKNRKKRRTLNHNPLLFLQARLSWPWIMFHQSGLDFTRAESGDERNADSFIDSEREQGYTDAVGRGEAHTRMHTQGIRPHVDYSMILGLLATLSFNPSFFSIQKKTPLYSSLCDTGN